MKNCLILGSGRSGTSMLAGMLHQAGYFLGDKLHKPLPSNPRGFFEWQEINSINEEILARYVRRSFWCTVLKAVTGRNSVASPGKNQRWLAAIPEHVDIKTAGPQEEDRMKKVLQREPFGYKDPRFSYTLPVWEKFMKPDTVLLCVFREPDVTVNSILKECREREYLASLHITGKSAFDVWTSMYAHILFRHDRQPGTLLFAHYNQILNGTALPHLSETLGVRLDAGFAERDLQRSAPGGGIPDRARQIYAQLCERSGYRSY
jgi:hypothetical protein